MFFYFITSLEIIEKKHYWNFAKSRINTGKLIISRQAQLLMILIYYFDGTTMVTLTECANAGLTILIWIVLNR